MRALLVTASLLLLSAVPGSAVEAGPRAAVCAPESYVPYVAVVQWSDADPVRLSVLPLTRPLGLARAVSLPEGLRGPVRPFCEAGSLRLWTPDDHVRITDPASRRPTVEPAPVGLTKPDDGDFAHFACREGQLVRGWVDAPRGKHRQLPGDLSRRYEPYSIGLRRDTVEGTDARRWRLVVTEDQRRGTPGGRLARSHVKRESTVLEMVCPPPGAEELGSRPVHEAALP